MNTAALDKYRKRLTDEKGSYFVDWPVEPEQREACWENLAQTLDALIALGKRGTVEDATEIFRQCVERYNELDEGFICTIEREELCDILYEIGDYCGAANALPWRLRVSWPILPCGIFRKRLGSSWFTVPCLLRQNRIVLSTLLCRQACMTRCCPNPWDSWWPPRCVCVSWYSTRMNRR